MDRGIAGIRQLRAPVAGVQIQTGLKLVLDTSHEQEDDEDEYDQAQTAAGVVSPTAAMGPSGQSSECNQEQNHDEYG